MTKAREETETTTSQENHDKLKNAKHSASKPS
jgi:hypothetical protein